MTTTDMNGMSGGKPPSSDRDDRVAILFADARALHDAALARLEAGDIRDAAEEGVVRHQTGRRRPHRGPHRRRARTGRPTPLVDCDISVLTTRTSTAP